MTLSAAFTEQVRLRARFACEYCGVTETDTGGLLTVDHFQPRVRGGADQLENLVYCCHRCNLYKGDYWPADSTLPSLWNPRREAMEAHLRLLSDGFLSPLTVVGAVTVERLRLNRPSLVAHRLRRQNHAAELRSLPQYRKLIALLTELKGEQSALTDEHRELLAYKRRLLRMLLHDDG